MKLNRDVKQLEKMVDLLIDLHGFISVTYGRIDTVTQCCVLLLNAL